MRYSTNGVSYFAVSMGELREQGYRRGKARPALLQIARGMFFAVYYPLKAAYLVLKTLLKAVAYVLYGIVFCVRWAIWPKSKSITQVLAFVTPVLATAHTLV